MISAKSAACAAHYLSRAGFPLDIVLLIVERAEARLCLECKDDLGQHVYLVDHTFLREHGSTQWDLLPKPEIIQQYAKPVCTLDELPLEMSPKMLFGMCKAATGLDGGCFFEFGARKNGTIRTRSEQRKWSGAREDYVEDLRNGTRHKQVMFYHPVKRPSARHVMLFFKLHLASSPHHYTYYDCDWVSVDDPDPFSAVYAKLRREFPGVKQWFPHEEIRYEPVVRIDAISTFPLAKHGIVTGDIIIFSNSPGLK